MLHRYFAYLTFVTVIFAAVVASREARRHGRKLARTAALAAPYLALLQVVLGMLTVRSGVAVFEAAAHLGGGALLLADMLTVYLALGPMGRRSVLRTAEGAA